MIAFYIASVARQVSEKLRFGYQLLITTGTTIRDRITKTNNQDKYIRRGKAKLISAHALAMIHFRINFNSLREIGIHPRSWPVPPEIRPFTLIGQ